MRPISWLLPKIHRIELSLIHFGSFKNPFSDLCFIFQHYFFWFDLLLGAHSSFFPFATLLIFKGKDKKKKKKNLYTHTHHLTWGVTYLTWAPPHVRGWVCNNEYFYNTFPFLMNVVFTEKIEPWFMYNPTPTLAQLQRILGWGSHNEYHPNVSWGCAIIRWEL